MKKLVLAALAASFLITTQVHAVVAPMVCPTGQTGTTVFFDGLEAGRGNFFPDAGPGVDVWSLSNVSSNTGTNNFVAMPVIEESTRSAAILGLPSPILLTTGYRMQFSHLFDFERDVATPDGGKVFYFTNTIIDDAGHLIDGGLAYNGAISLTSDNPKAGQQAFVGDTDGVYVVTRLNLNSLAGQTLNAFGFEFSSNSTVNSAGWRVDDVHVYHCQDDVTPPSPPPPPPPPPSPPVPRYCQGVRATLVGTNGPDVLNGTSVRDVIVALGGNDIVRGRGGNDLICGGSGKDKLYGQAGRDKLYGDSGSDFCDGGIDRDKAFSCAVVRNVP